MLPSLELIKRDMRTEFSVGAGKLTHDQRCAIWNQWQESPLYIVGSLLEVEFQTLEIELCEKRIREYTAARESKISEQQVTKDKLSERKLDLEQKKGELNEIVAETKQEEEKLREQAKHIEGMIEPRLLTAFKRIRKNARNGLAVVYVQRDACGGCFNKIPAQRQLDIRLRKKVIVCEYCGRILVDQELAGVAPASAE